MIAGRPIALTIQTFVSQVMSQLFNMWSRFVIAFLLKTKCLNFMAVVTVHSDLQFVIRSKCSTVPKVMCIIQDLYHLFENKYLTTGDILFYLNDIHQYLT